MSKGNPFFGNKNVRVTLLLSLIVVFICLFHTNSSMSTECVPYHFVSRWKPSLEQIGHHLDNLVMEARKSLYFHHLNRTVRTRKTRTFIQL